MRQAPDGPRDQAHAAHRLGNSFSVSRELLRVVRAALCVSKRAHPTECFAASSSAHLLKHSGSTTTCAPAPAARAIASRAVAKFAALSCTQAAATRMSPPALASRRAQRTSPTRTWHSPMVKEGAGAVIVAMARAPDFSARRSIGPRTLEQQQHDENGRTRKRLRLADVRKWRSTHEATRLVAVRIAAQAPPLRLWQ